MRKCIPVCIFVVLSLLSGCASKSRLLEEPTPFSKDLGIHTESPQLSVTVNHVILPNGAGSWVKDAKWDEYVLTIQNQGKGPLTIQGFWLIDVRGIYLKSRDEPGRLETISEALAEEYKTVQLKTAVGVATAAASSTLIAGSAASTGALASAGPVALLALPFVPYFEFKAKEAKELEMANIERQFVSRRLRSFRLAENAALQGSQFFPVIPNPRELVVEYRAEGESRELSLSLEKLRGIHEALAKKLEIERKRKEENAWF